MLKHYRIRHYNFKMMNQVIALAVIGIIRVESAEPSLQNRQFAGFTVGIFLMIVISLFDYSVILKLYWLIYIFNLVLLILVNYWGEERNASQRWLKILGIQFQPSEIAKIFMILFFAQFIYLHRQKLNSFKYIVLSCILFAAPAYLIIDQPDLSTTIIVSLIFAVVMFTGGLSWKVIAGFLAVAVPAAAILFVLILQPDQKIINSYQQRRIIAFLNKEEYANAEGYKQAYAVMANGTGQLSGNGYMTN